MTGTATSDLVLSTFDTTKTTGNITTGSGNISTTTGNISAGNLLKSDIITSNTNAGITFSDKIIVTTNGIQFSDGLQTQAYTGGASGWDGIATSDLVLSTFNTTTTSGNFTSDGGTISTSRQRAISPHMIYG